MHVGEVDRFCFFLAADYKGVAFFHPGVGVLVLEAIIDGLLEQSVAVEDSVAGDRKVHGGARVQEAGCQAAQAPIAKSGVMLGLENRGQLLAESGSGFGGFLKHVEIDEVVEKGPTLKELGREVVFLSSRPVQLRRCIPVISNLVHDKAGEARPELGWG